MTNINSNQCLSVHVCVLDLMICCILVYDKDQIEESLKLDLDFQGVYSDMYGYAKNYMHALCRPADVHMQTQHMYCHPLAFD